MSELTDKQLESMNEQDHLDHISDKQISEIDTLLLQIQEQESLIAKYRAEILKKDEQLLNLETMLVDNVVDRMIDQKRGK